MEERVVVEPVVAGGVHGVDAPVLPVVGVAGHGREVGDRGAAGEAAAAGVDAQVHAGAVVRLPPGVVDHAAAHAGPGGLDATVVAGDAADAAAVGVAADAAGGAPVEDVAQLVGLARGGVGDVGPEAAVGEAVGGGHAAEVPVAVRAGHSGGDVGLAEELALVHVGVSIHVVPGVELPRVGGAAARADHRVRAGSGSGLAAAAKTAPLQLVAVTAAVGVRDAHVHAHARGADLVVGVHAGGSPVGGDTVHGGEVGRSTDEATVPGVDVHVHAATVGLEVGAGSAAHVHVGPGSTETALAGVAAAAVGALALDGTGQVNAALLQVLVHARVSVHRVLGTAESVGDLAALGILGTGAGSSHSVGAVGTALEGVLVVVVAAVVGNAAAHAASSLVLTSSNAQAAPVLELVGKLAEKLENRHGLLVHTARHDVAKDLLELAMHVAVISAKHQGREGLDFLAVLQVLGLLNALGGGLLDTVELVHLGDQHIDQAQVSHVLSNPAKASLAVGSIAGNLGAVAAMMMVVDGARAVSNASSAPVNAKGGAGASVQGPGLPSLLGELTIHVRVQVTSRVAASILLRLVKEVLSLVTLALGGLRGLLGLLGLLGLELLGLLGLLSLIEIQKVLGGDLGLFLKIFCGFLL
mmetsp:Transcript_9544/g.21917  ORF Transcript_9544/g.21917 Transcript_9544/m.21917 type:complete len:639 (+) Transcript_9544:209-2125(+)